MEDKKKNVSATAAAGIKKMYEMSPALIQKSVEAYDYSKMSEAFYGEKINRIQAGLKDPGSKQVFERCEQELFAVVEQTNKLLHLLEDVSGGYRKKTLLNRPTEFASPEDREKTIAYCADMASALDQFNENIAAVLGFKPDRDFRAEWLSPANPYLFQMYLPVTFYSFTLETRSNIIKHLYQLLEANLP